MLRIVDKVSYRTAWLNANTAEVQYMLVVPGSSLCRRNVLWLPSTAPPDTKLSVHKNMYVPRPSRFMSTQTRNKNSRQSATTKTLGSQTNYHFPCSSRYSATHPLSLSAPGTAQTRPVRTQPSCFSEGRFVNEWTTGQDKRLAVWGASHFEGGGTALSCEQVVGDYRVA